MNPTITVQSEEKHELSRNNFHRHRQVNYNERHSDQVAINDDFASKVQSGRRYAASEGYFKFYFGMVFAAFWAVSDTGVAKFKN